MLIRYNLTIFTFLLELPEIINTNILNLLPTKVAHYVSGVVIDFPILWSFWETVFRPQVYGLQTSVAGINLPSPVGTAAGLDKNCKALSTFLHLGFGFAVGGTVTLNKRLGYSPPRLVRLKEQQALYNRMGFPNNGATYSAENMIRLKESKDIGRVFVSISGDSTEDILKCALTLAPHCTILEVNVSCPSIPNLQNFQNPKTLLSLTEELSKSNLPVPFLVKLPPWEDNINDIKNSIALAYSAATGGAAGLVIANTKKVVISDLSTDEGGLSGVPLFQDTLRMVEEVNRSVNGIDIIASGGITSAKDVWRVLARGACAAEIYTALVYQGPFLPRRINLELKKMMEVAGIDNVADIGGEPPEL